MVQGQGFEPLSFQFQGLTEIPNLKASIMHTNIDSVIMQNDVKLAPPHGFEPQLPDSESSFLPIERKGNKHLFIFFSTSP